jgi:hypothetical protein
MVVAVSEQPPESGAENAFDYSTLPPPVDEPPIIPNHTASREKKARWFNSRPPGDQRSTPQRKTAPRKSIPRTKPGYFVEPLQQVYVGLGMMMMPIDPVCANAVITSAEQCAISLDKLAQENDAVRRALLALTKTSTLSAVFIAHMPIILAVGMHHVPAIQMAMGRMGQEFAETVAQQMQPPTPPETP